MRRFFLWTKIMKERRVTNLRYVLTWFNPGKKRPNELPQFLAISPFEEELTLPSVIVSNWTLNGYAIGIFFLDMKTNRKMDQEKRASIRKKRMHTRIEKTAPLFAEEFEKKELEQRADYFAGKQMVDDSALNERINDFANTMTPGEAVRYLLSLEIPTEMSEEDKKFVADVRMYQERHKLFASPDFKARLLKKQAEKAERDRLAREAMMDIRNEPLFAGI